MFNLVVFTTISFVGKYGAVEVVWPFKEYLVYEPGAIVAAAVTSTLKVPLIEPWLFSPLKVRVYEEGVSLEGGLNVAVPLELKVAQIGQVPPVVVVEKTGVGFPP